MPAPTFVHDERPVPNDPPPPNLDDNDRTRSERPSKVKESRDFENNHDQDRPRRRSRTSSGGMPVWGWVLLGFGGILVLGGALALGISIGRKTGEVAQKESAQSKKSDPDSEQLRRLQDELATLRKEQTKKPDPDFDQLKQLQEEVATLRNLLAKERDRALRAEERSVTAKRGGVSATDQGQSWLGEWTQEAGPGTMHVEFRSDGTTRSWVSLTKDQLTSTGMLMKAGTIMPDSNGKPLFIEGWWKMMNDGRLMIQTNKDSTDLPKDFTQEMSKWSKKK